MLCIFEEFGYGRKDEGDSDSDSLILFDECCLYEQQASLQSKNPLLDEY